MFITLLYPDSIYKELIAFKEKFKDFCNEEGVILPDVAREEITNAEENF